MDEVYRIIIFLLKKTIILIGHFSDTSHLTILQEISSVSDNIMLFSRRGMANNGWHRFRVPLRPSFKPVSIKFVSSLPENAFITLSNTRLVNERDEEMSCEIIENRREKDDSTKALQIVEISSTQKPSTFSALPITLFNPFKPMFERGIAPIIPLKEHMPRLTAFQNLKPFTVSGIFN